MDQLVSVVDIGALTAFTLLHASVVGWFAVGRRGRPVIWRRHMPAPVAGAAITVAVIVEPSGTAQVVGAEGEELARRCASYLASVHPTVDVVVYDGGQERYPVLLGVE